MAAAEDLMSAGLAAGLAKRIGLEIPVTGLTATGANQAGALALTSNFSIFGTVAASTGCICSGDKDSIIVNGGANALSVYPPVGFAINGAAANAAISVPAGKSILTIPARGSAIGAIVSA